MSASALAGTVRREEVAVVIPAHDEEATIGGIVAAAAAFGRVIVCDDGSRDETARRAREAGASVLRHPLRLGKGRALATAIDWALRQGAALVITLDADGQHRPADIPRFLAAARAHPHHIVIGSRRRSAACQPRARRIANRIADFWISWAAGHPVADSQCGFRCYPRAALAALAPLSRWPAGFSFETALLIAAARRGFKTVALDIPAIYGGAGQRASHFRPVRDIAAIIGVVALFLLVRGLAPRSLWRALTLPMECFECDPP